MKRTPRSASRRASRQLAANVPGFRDVGSVQFEDVRQAPSRDPSPPARCLHAEGHLVLRDHAASISGIHARVVFVHPVELAQSYRASRRRLDAMTPSGLLRYSTGSLPPRNCTPWYCEGRKPLPQSRAYSGWSPFARARQQHDERRQVVVLAAQPVAEPRADRGAAGDLRAGLEERDRGVVVDRLGVHRPHDAQTRRRSSPCAAAAR